MSERLKTAARVLLGDGDAEFGGDVIELHVELDAGTGGLRMRVVAERSLSGHYRTTSIKTNQHGVITHRAVIDS